MALPRHHQFVKSVDLRVVLERNLVKRLCKGKVRETLEKRREYLLQFNARKPLSKAAVNAVAKSQVIASFARKV